MFIIEGKAASGRSMFGHDWDIVGSTVDESTAATLEDAKWLCAELRATDIADDKFPHTSYRARRLADNTIAHQL
jgi:hypothetical protein